MLSRRARRYVSDGVLIVGGARAILLQVADPTVGAGVARHSDFAHRPVQRLRNTLTFAYAVVLGTPEDVARVAAFVNRAHVPVHRAEDAALQLWVAATLYDTAVRVHDRVFRPAPDVLADELYLAYSALGTALQMPTALWPADRIAFATYWATRMSDLVVTDDARRIAHDLFTPVSAPRWLRAGLPLARLLTLDLLPASIRDAYALEWSPCDERRARRAWGVIRLLTRITPHRLRSTPYRRLLRALRSPN